MKGMIPSFIRDRLQKTGPLVIGKPVEPVQALAGASSKAQVIALRPQVEPVLDESTAEKGHPEVISSLSNVPMEAPILTANVGRPLFPLPRHLEAALMVLEVGQKRVQIYFDPESKASDLESAIKELRQRLVIESYEIEGRDQPCKADIMAALLENFKKRAQSFDGKISDSASRKLWDSWVDVAWRARASDLHVEFLNGQANVRIRVDGELVSLPNSDQGRHTASQADSAISWAFGENTRTDSNNKSHWTAAAKSQAYAMFKPRAIDNATVSMRFQSLPGAYGPKVVLRLADENAKTLSFAELGFERSQQALFRNASKLDSGLVLFTGTTGSGKTTAIKTYLETHPMNGSHSILTLEEPVELPIRGTHQYSAQRDLSDPVRGRQQYKELVAGALRLDPDGVMVGELRDDVTVAAMKQILETGHFGASTLHAKFLSGIAARLEMEDMGFSRGLFTAPTMVNLLIFMALAPLLCPHCKINGAHEHEFKNVHFGNLEMKDLDVEIAEVRRSLGILADKFNIESKEVYFRRATGCDCCGGKGTIGRTAVAEMFQPDRKWLDLTRKGDDQGALDHYRSFSDKDFYSDDMTGKTVFEHTLYKALRGWTDIRQCEVFETFDKFEILK